MNRKRFGDGDELFCMGYARTDSSDVSRCVTVYAGAMELFLVCFTMLQLKFISDLCFILWTSCLVQPKVTMIM